MYRNIVLVTGIAGFIGFHVARDLIKRGYKVIGVDNLNDYYSPLLKVDRLKELGLSLEIEKINKNKLYSTGNLFFLYGDITEQLTWEILASLNPSRVIHLAAQAGVRYSLTNPMTYIKSNILGFQYVLDFCVNKGINGLIYASSSSVYGMGSTSPFRETEFCGEPESLYAATKRSNELMAHSYFKTKKLSSIGLRFFTVYGPYGRPDMMPMLLADSIMNDKPIEVFNNGNQFRDFTFIEDICKGVLGCFDYVSQNDNFNSIILNIGKGEPTNLLDFIDKLEEKMQKKVLRVYKPSQLGDVTQTYSNNDRIFQLLGFVPEVSLDKGLDLFIHWYKNRFFTS